VNTGIAALTEEWINGYRAGLERSAEIAKMCRRGDMENLIRDELAEAVISGSVASRGAPPNWQRLSEPSTPPENEDARPRTHPLPSFPNCRR